MITRKTGSIKEYCQNRIWRRMCLKYEPDVSVIIRKFEGPDGAGHYKIQPNEWNIIEPSEFWRGEGYFNRVKGKVAEEYPQLYKDTDINIPFRAYLIEPIVFTGSSATKISGGFNFVIMGVLKNGEKYCAVVDVEVRPLLRRCGLMTLMKHTEFELARREKCDFIQTWHWSYNHDFNAAIVPSLKKGFILYHDHSGNKKAYEDIGQIHLRYYFNRLKRRNVQVLLKNRKKFMSPEENSGIINYLESCPDSYPGRTIRRIEEYGQAKTNGKRKITERITDNLKGEPVKQLIFIDEGMAGFEYTKQRNTYRTGDVMSFCPAVRIDHCEKSDQNKPYIKHVFGSIYELHFKPISMIHSKDPFMRPGEDCILEVSKDLRLFYSTINRDKDRKFHLKIDQWYKGCGTLSICNHRDSIYDKAPSLMKDALTKGKLVSISEKLMNEDIWSKYQKQVKRLNYGKGTYRDMEEFKLDMLSPCMKKPVEFKSTDLPEPFYNFTELIFCVDIAPQSF